MKEQNKSTLMLIAAMVIFGTIGMFRRFIPMPSSTLAMMRGILGTVFLLIFMGISRKKISYKLIKKKFALLVLSGAMIGFNWVLLFESYNRTTVAVATICYYMAPVFVMIVSPIFLKEKLNVIKVLCIMCALGGMVLVSGIAGGDTENANIIGVLFGFGAAILYATVIVLNQKIKEVPAYDKTIMQLGSAAVVMIPYVFFTESDPFGELSVFIIVMVLVVGLLNTAIAYALYFGSMKSLPAQKVALFGYIDPVVAILLSAFVLREHMGVFEIIGIVLILGATVLSEFSDKIVTRMIKAKEK